VDKLLHFYNYISLCYLLQPNVLGLIVAYAFDVPEECPQRREGAIPWDLEDGIFLYVIIYYFLI
jgi:hypothetical protein